VMWVLSVVSHRIILTKIQEGECIGKHDTRKTGRSHYG
jgi:hypothetical protein